MKMKKYSDNAYINKKINKIYKIVSSTHDSCIAVGSLSPSKQAMTDILNILNILEDSKNDKIESKKSTYSMNECMYLLKFNDMGYIENDNVRQGIARMLPSLTESENTCVACMCGDKQLYTNEELKIIFKVDYEAERIKYEEELLKDMEEKNE